MGIEHFLLLSIHVEFQSTVPRTCNKMDIFELTWNIKDNLRKPDFSEPTMIKAVVYLGKIIIYLAPNTYNHILKALGICFNVQYPPYSLLLLK